MSKPLIRPLFSACLLSCLFAPVHALPTKVSFTPAEHTEIGNQVKLRYSPTDQGEVGQPLPLKNGLQLTYGEILSFGDFYGLVDEPISLGHTEEIRRKRFIDAFNTLAENLHATTEAPQILRLIRQERKIIDTAISSGTSIDKAYKDLGNTIDIQFNCITGGGCSELTWLVNFGRYMKLAASNYDHFGEEAILAYQTGHQIAMEVAMAAHHNKDVNQLKLAYAMNAFACHFLTDRFAAGHIRTPRLKLSENTTLKIIGSALTSYMHTEENHYGLHVSNAHGDHWVAFGDKTYFKPETEKHRKMINQAVQASADHIFYAYLSGYNEIHDSAYVFIPRPDEENNHSKLDLSPMFYWDEASNTLYRRTSLPLRYSREWTNDWWGWTTFLELRNARGFEMFEQAILAHSSLGKAALKDGFITEPSLVAYVKQQAR